MYCAMVACVLITRARGSRIDRVRYLSLSECALTFVMCVRAAVQERGARGLSAVVLTQVHRRAIFFCYYYLTLR